MTQHRAELEGKGRTVLVTGASSGIGAAFADVFAGNGFDVVLCARSEERLASVGRAVEQRHGVRAYVLAADLSDPEAPARIFRDLAARGLVVDALVNNAGFSISGNFERTEWAREAALLQVLVTAYTQLTRLFLPVMLERRWGRIVQVASVSGLLPATPAHGLNAASKAFTVQLALALGAETRGTGVHVTAVCPGFTRTELHERAGMLAEIARVPRFLWSDPELVARRGYAAVSRGQSLVIPAWPDRLMCAAARLLPPGIAGALARRGTARLGSSPS